MKKCIIAGEKGPDHLKNVRYFIGIISLHSEKPYIVTTKAIKEAVYFMREDVDKAIEIAKKHGYDNVTVLEVDSAISKRAIKSFK
jgi:hypothetical protein